MKQLHDPERSILPTYFLVAPRTSLVVQTVESTCSAGDPSSIPGSIRSPGEGNDNSLQYSSLENSMDRGA